MPRCCLLVLLVVAAIVEASQAFSPSSTSTSSSSHSTLALHHRTPSSIALAVDNRSGSGAFSLLDRRRLLPLRASADGNGDGETSSSSSSSMSKSSSSASLAEKMKSWEATEEEMRASTLGGVVPGLSAPGMKGFDGKFGSDKGTATGGGRTDAFDVGLYIAFPIMVLSCLAVSSVV